MYFYLAKLLDDKKKKKMSLENSHLVLPIFKRPSTIFVPEKVYKLYLKENLDT